MQNVIILDKNVCSFFPFEIDLDAIDLFKLNNEVLKIMTHLMFSKFFYSTVHSTLIKSKCWVLKIRPVSHFLAVMPFGISKWNPSACKSWTCVAYVVNSWWSPLNIRTQSIISHGFDLISLTILDLAPEWLGFSVDTLYFSKSVTYLSTSV